MEVERPSPNSLTQIHSDDESESDDNGDDETPSSTTANSSILAKLREDPPPDPLPEGWNMHRSRSQPGYVYYFNQFTGECQWDTPFTPLEPPPADFDGDGDEVAPPKLTTGLTEKLDSLIEQTVKPILKRGKQTPDTESTSPTLASSATANSNNETSNPRSRKRRQTSNDTTNDNATKSRRSSSSSTPSATPDQVHVLHILRKHEKSRRPSSWRSPTITISRADAVAELEEIRAILEESASDPKELRATFEELARTESDCSSARKGGDLGFFGRKKMQPNFEKASFALKIGELSGIVDTKSGVHVLLRVG